MTDPVSSKFRMFVDARLARMAAEQEQFQRTAAKAIATLESIERSLDLIDKQKEAAQ